MTRTSGASSRRPRIETVAAASGRRVARHTGVVWRLGLVALVGLGCQAMGSERVGSSPGNDARSAPPGLQAAPETSRRYLLERVDDAAVVQLYADGFADLSLREKTLAWHLYRAALAGRDIYYDQRYEHGLEMREVLEEIVTHAGGVEPGAFQEIERYTKLFWLNNGPYHNLSGRKFTLQLPPAAFAAAARAAAEAGATFPLRAGERLDQLLERLGPEFFDAGHRPIVTNKAPSDGGDILASSAANLYVGVTMADLAPFPERYPLNSRLVRREGMLVEEVYRLGGKYGDRIADIVGHLERAVPHATPPMADALQALVAYYRSGEVDERRAYDIAWVEDDASPVDTINGFIEVYLDPRGVKGAWEGLVFYVNHEKTANIEALATHAQWFEDRMPWDPRYRKPAVRGIVARAIDVVVATGEAGPVCAIGINLPNDQQIRERHGSKSVSLSNVMDAFERAMPSGFRQEFSWTDDEVARTEAWGSLASELSTNMHEVIGHASGQIAPHLDGRPELALKEHYSAVEEARADLVALYFMPDLKLVEIGLVPAAAQEAIVRAEYESYTRNALVQLRRVRDGDRLDDAHLRNRQLIVRWLMDNSDAIATRTREGETYYVLTDVAAFRDGVGRLLAEIHRIKAEGDYAAAARLFEAYGIEFDPALRDEVVARAARHDLPGYTGFVMPRLEAITGSDGEIADVRVSYPMDLTAQMLEYSGKR